MGVNLGIDTDDFAIQVEQRPTRIARIDSDVGLQERDVTFIRQGTRLGGDNTSGNTVFKTKWRANGDHPFTNTRTLRIPDLDYRQVAGGDLECSHIRSLVYADNLGFEFALVSKFNGDFICIRDDMRVG